MNPQYPLPSDTFLTVTNGVPVWTPPALEHLCTPCPCSPCTWSNVNTQESTEMNHQLAQLGASFLKPSSRWPLVQSKENVSSSPPWKLALENVPLLSDQFCESLIARRNIPFAIRSVARVLAINLQPNLLEKFGASTSSPTRNSRKPTLTTR